MHPCDQPDKGGCSDFCEKDGNNANCNCSKNGFKLDSDGKTCCKLYLFYYMRKLSLIIFVTFRIYFNEKIRINL